MAYDLIITGGKVVLSDEVVCTDIGIKNGKIVAIGDQLAEAKERVEANGMYVLPGAVDVHVHLCEPGRTEWEGFETGTRALAKGGTTCYVDMPLNNLPATTDAGSCQLKLDAAKEKNYVDYALYGGLVPHNLGKLSEQNDMGVVGFKCFVATCGFGVAGDFKNVEDYALYKGMLEAKELNQMVAIHCESANICDLLAEEAISKNEKDVDAYVDSRPKFTEVEAVRRVLFLGKVTGCQLHFVHLSCVEAVDEVYRAKSENMDVSIESCPHYLNLNREIFKERLGSIGKCSPPLRSIEDTEKMWDAFREGKIEILGSDHSPCPPAMKEAPDGDMFKAWGGLSAGQNVLDLMFDEAVQKRGICPSQLMRTLSKNPAKRFGLKDKGEINLGKDADIVLLKPNAPYTLKSEDLEYRHKHSPYVGSEIGCQIVKTFVRGNEVYSKDKGVIGTPLGQFVRKI